MGNCIRVSAQRLDRIDSTPAHQEPEQKWRLYPNQLAKGGWFTAFYIMDIYLPRSQHQGSGNRYSGYFLLLHLTPFFKRSILAWIDGDGGGLILVYTLLTTILTIPTYILEPKFDSCIFYSLSLLPVLQPLPCMPCTILHTAAHFSNHHPILFPLPRSQLPHREG